jgi:hypothetical protein
MVDNPTIFNQFFCNPNYTPTLQIFVALAYGILLSPFAWGLFWLFISILIYEWFFYVFTRGCKEYWDSRTRAGVFVGFVTGYIIGRSLAEVDVLTTGTPTGF